MVLPVVECRVYREVFPGTPDVEVLTYVAIFETARENTLEPGYHVVSLHHMAARQRDGLSINGLWIEDLHGDDYFCSELWTELVRMTFDEFEDVARQYKHVFNPKHPDAGQIVL